MSRKSKFNEEIARRLVTLIHEGLNFKTACLKVGISEDSFARYRRANPDFDRQIKKAQKSFKKEKNLENTAINENASKQVVYGKGTDNHLDAVKPLETPLNASESLSRKPGTYRGVPVYYELSEDIEPYETFYYPLEDSFQFFNYDRVRFSCPSDLWSKKHSTSIYGDEWVEEPGSPF